VTEYVGAVVAPAGMGMKPESAPPVIPVQGAANVDWVAVWFLGPKTKLIVSPTAATT